jgi:hypothetical protein
VGYKFERGRLEKCLDKSVKLEIRIHATLGETDVEDPRMRPISEWATCKEDHRHWWDVCDYRRLFNEKQAEDGLTLKERLISRLDDALEKRLKKDQEEAAKVQAAKDVPFL